MMRSNTSTVSLNIAVIYSPPSANRCFLNGTACPRPGVNVEMAQLACTALKFNCTFTWAGTDAFGYLENGTWRGVIGSIKDGTFDIGLPRFAPTYDRFAAVDFSHAYLFDPMMLVTRQSANTDQTVTLDLVGGFRWHVWLCITSLMFLAVHLMEDTLIFKRKQAIIDVVLEKHASKLLRECKRFCIALMSLAALILLRSYTGYIFSQGIALYPQMPFTDLATFVQCMETGKCRMAVQSPTYGYCKDVISGDTELLRRLRAVLAKAPLIVPPTMADMLTAIQKETSVYLVGFASAMDFYYAARHDHCSFYKLTTVFSAAPGTIPIPKKFPYRKELDHMALAMRESGMSDKILSNYYRVSEDSCPKAKQELKAASMRFLMDVFIFFGGGLLLSMGAFSGEVIVGWIEENIRQKPAQYVDRNCS